MEKTWMSMLALLLSLAVLAGCGAPAEPVPSDMPLTPATTEPAPVKTPPPQDASTGPVSTPAALPTETPAPTEEPGRLLSLSAQEQYEANIFLSNFSEQGFCAYRFDHFDAEAPDEAQLFSFAHLWAKINNRSVIGYDGDYETMSVENVNVIIGRYFGLAIRPEDGTDFSAALGMGNYDWDRCWYEGGLFYYPAADGEVYTRFTVVDSAEALSGSRTRFRFTVYALDLQRYWDNNGIPGEYYRLTPEEAVQRMVAGEITPVHTGVATGTPCYLESSGRESYNLLSYRLDDIAS